MKKKIQNIALFILVRLYALVRGRADVVPKEVCRFLVINVTENIGDMVCTTPVFRAIKSKNPHAHITVLGVPKNKLMLEGNMDIDRYIDSKQSFLTLVRELRKETFDAGIMINPSLNDFALFFFGGVKAISCFALDASFGQQFSRTYENVSRLALRTVYTPGSYIPRQYIRLLLPFHLDSDDIRKHLAYTREGDLSVIKTLHEATIGERDTIVAIAPGAGTKIKQWPSERFGEVANHLSCTYGVSIAIIGGPRDLEEVTRMKTVFAPTVRYCDFRGQSLDELKATLSKVALIIGNDSGPIYIAESFGAGAIVLVGPTDELEHPLQDRTHRVVIAPERGSALLRSGLSSEDDIDLDAARSQINAITVPEVCAEIDDLFTELKIERSS